MPFPFYKKSNGMELKNALVKIEFEEVMQFIRALLIPIVEANRNDELFEYSIHGVKNKRFGGGFSYSCFSA